MPISDFILQLQVIAFSYLQTLMVQLRLERALSKQVVSYLPGHPPELKNKVPLAHVERLKEEVMGE